MVEPEMKRLKEVGKRLADANKKLTDTKRIAMWAAQEAAEKGIPETVIAAELGVDRARTLRKWLGKG